MSGSGRTSVGRVNANAWTSKFCLSLVLTGLCVAACSDPGGSGAGPGPSSASAPAPSRLIQDSGDSVLTVRIQEGERCPQAPVTPDPDCSPVPLPRVLVQVVDGSGDVIATGQSSGSGRVDLRVPSGRYTVRGADLAAYRLTPATDVDVPSEGRVEVLLTYGNGIQ